MSEHGHPNIFPTLRYRDAAAAIDWLGRAFGFEEKAIYRSDDGVIQHSRAAARRGARDVRPAQ